MRIRPDGVELLQAARAVIAAAIAPHLADDRLDTLRTIERAMALAEDRLARDEDASPDELAVLEDARAAMRGEVLGSLPEASRYDARLVAKAISVAALQLANAHAAERREYEGLAALLGIPAAPESSPGEIRRSLPSLNERLVARIRAGEADPGTLSYAATIMYLEATVHEALSETYSPDPRHSPAPAAPPIDTVGAWLRPYGVVGEAVYAASNAVLTAQADVVGWFTERLAANPRVPMAAVEGAHQAHDLSRALADVNAALFELALVPFRRVDARPADATRVR